jgi:hypothetical protein
MKNHIKQFIEQLPPEYYKFIDFVTELQIENENLKYDLAIIYEHTNLRDCEENPKENWIEAIKMIRARTEKYEDLKATAGPLYQDGQEGEDKP